MKRLLIMLTVLLALHQPAAYAQERSPLAMEITFQWTAAGALLGAALGAMLWLTDPGNPNNKLSRSAMEGAGWGTLAGAGFSIFIMGQSIQGVQRQASLDQPMLPPRRFDGLREEDNPFLVAQTPLMVVPLVDYRF